MKKYFRTRYSVILGIPLWGLIVLVFYVANGQQLIGENIPQVSLQGLIFLFVGTVWFGTYYIIHDSKLIIKIGPFTHSTIETDNIESINRSSDAIASPASSLRRIRLNLIDGTFVLISPAKELSFIQTLKERNPKIYNGIHQSEESNLFIIRIINWLL